MSFLPGRAGAIIFFLNVYPVGCIRGLVIDGDIKNAARLQKRGSISNCLPEISRVMEHPP